MGTDFAEMSFWTFNIAYRDKDRILDQKYEERKILRILVMKNLDFKSEVGKLIIDEIQHITTGNS